MTDLAQHCFDTLAAQNRLRAGLPMQTVTIPAQLANDLLASLSECGVEILNYDGNDNPVSTRAYMRLVELRDAMTAQGVRVEDC